MSKINRYEFLANYKSYNQKSNNKIMLENFDSNSNDLPPSHLFMDLDETDELEEANPKSKKLDGQKSKFLNQDKNNQNQKQQQRQPQQHQNHQQNKKFDKPKFDKPNFDNFKKQQNFQQPQIPQPQQQFPQPIPQQPVVQQQDNTEILKTQKILGNMYKKIDDLMTKIEKQQKVLDYNTSQITQKFSKMERDLEDVKEPSDDEKYNRLVSVSQPFNLKLSDYWADKDEKSNETKEDNVNLHYISKEDLDNEYNPSMVRDELYGDMLRNKNRIYR